MFRAAERGIVVANARDDLLQRLGDAPVYRARQPRADGVREALERWLG
jgi:hydroxymethylpyrimidine pyrophosphatase-like HAD family hydrolase